MNAISIGCCGLLLQNRLRENNPAKIDYVNINSHTTLRPKPSHHPHANNGTNLVQQIAEKVSSSEFTFTFIVTIIISVFVPGRCSTNPLFSVFVPLLQDAGEGDSEEAEET
jgi:hypothetical protein